MTDDRVERIRERSAAMARASADAARALEAVGERYGLADRATQIRHLAAHPRDLADLQRVELEMIALLAQIVDMLTTPTELPVHKQSREVAGRD